jgi:hypothetical protein
VSAVAVGGVYIAIMFVLFGGPVVGLALGGITAWGGGCGAWRQLGEEVRQRARR